MSSVLTVQQIANKLHITHTAVRRYLRAGKLRGQKIGRSWQVLESDLQLWVSTRRSSKPGPFVSARGFLKRFPGRLSSADVIADKRREAEIEESKFRPKCGR